MISVNQSWYLFVPSFIHSAYSILICTFHAIHRLLASAEFISNALYLARLPCLCARSRSSHISLMSSSGPPPWLGLEEQTSTPLSFGRRSAASLPNLATSFSPTTCAMHFFFAIIRRSRGIIATALRKKLFFVASASSAWANGESSITLRPKRTGQTSILSSTALDLLQIAIGTTTSITSRSRATLLLARRRLPATALALGMRKLARVARVVTGAWAVLVVVA